MLKKILAHYNIVLSRKNILLKLFYLRIVYSIFYFKKRIRKIRKPIVHYYCVCWNEEKIIPYMFNHHDSFVDHYYIYDNGSNDGTISALEKHPNVTIINFDTNGEFDVLTNQKIKNTVWKKSRGKADWVIVCDIDEFIYHKNIPQLLSSKKYSVFKPKGFDMYTDKLPQSQSIVEEVRMGIPTHFMNKMILFDPHKIVEINYASGSHDASPEGIVLINEFETFLLHYKNLGIDYLLARTFILKNRYNKDNQKKGYGKHYQYDEEKIIKNFLDGFEKSEKVI